MYLFYIHKSVAIIKKIPKWIKNEECIIEANYASRCDFKISLKLEKQRVRKYYNS